MQKLFFHFGHKKLPSLALKLNCCSKDSLLNFINTGKSPKSVVIKSHIHFQFYCRLIKNTFVQQQLATNLFAGVKRIKLRTESASRTFRTLLS